MLPLSLPIARVVVYVYPTHDKVFLYPPGDAPLPYPRFHGLPPVFKMDVRKGNGEAWVKKYLGVTPEVKTVEVRVFPPSDLNACGVEDEL